MSADVAEMYRQVELQKCDQDFHRILFSLSTGSKNFSQCQKAQNRHPLGNSVIQFNARNQYSTRRNRLPTSLKFWKRSLLKPKNWNFLSCLSSNDQTFKYYFRRLPPVMEICTRPTQADNTPCRAHCHYNETFKLLVISLNFLPM